MREIQVSVIAKNIKEMCIEANHFLSEDMKEALYQASEKEKKTFREANFKSIKRKSYK